MESVKAQHSVDALDLEAMKSVDALVSVNALDSDVAMESVDVVPDSVDVVVLDSVKLVPCSKSRGVALRPHLPFFRLATMTGMF